MSYFGDLMDTEDKRMNPDWDLEDDAKLFKNPAVKDFSLKIKSAGGKAFVSNHLFAVFIE
jgi:hypothetical protein